MTQATATPRATTPGRTTVQGGQTQPVVLPPGAPTPPPDGAVVVEMPAPRPGGNDDVPQGAIVIGIAFFVTVAVIAIGWPLARAFGRRMDRGAAAPPALSRELTDRLLRIENTVDSIAIEVERISEGQRFTTKLLAERSEPAAVERRMGAGS